MNKRTKSDHFDMNFRKLSIFNYDLYISVQKDFKFQFEIHNRILFFSACLILLKLPPVSSFIVVKWKKSQRS